MASTPNDGEPIIWQRSYPHAPMIPREERPRATLGKEDTALFSITGYNAKTGKLYTLPFKSIPLDTFDWNDETHISRLNYWIRRVYDRAGKLARTQALWSDEENVWLELYYHLSIADALKRAVQSASISSMLAAFNNTFAGQISEEGELFKPRTKSSLKSKMFRMRPELRLRLSNCSKLCGKEYVPKITHAMVLEYREMKDKMAAKGIEEESAYSDGLQEWLELLANLPAEDVSRAENVEQAVKNVYTADEYPAAETLIMLSRL